MNYKNIMYILITISLLINSGFYAQNSWLWQNPWPTGMHLNDVWITNDSTIICDGYGGGILYSNDSGASWREIIIDDFEYTIGLEFVNAQIGYSLGNIYNNNMLLKTIDGGQTWTSRNIPLDRKLSDLFFINENIGWVLSDLRKVFKTTDGGLTWEEQTIDRGLYLYSIYFTDSLKGWIVGQSGLMANTIDGGETWNCSEFNQASDLLHISFVSPDSGWICGLNSSLNGAIFATTDSGATWQEQKSLSQYEVIYQVFTINNKKLRACTHKGRVLKSDNGGINWDVSSSYGNYPFYSIHFLDDSLGYTVGVEGRIFNTNDGGISWHEVNYSVTYNNINSIKMINEYIGWAIGSTGTLLKTIDEGENWNQIVINNINYDQSLLNFTKLEVLNSDKIFIAGYLQDSAYTSESKGIIINTNDNGLNWDIIVFDEVDEFLDLSIVNDSIGYALSLKYLDRFLYKTVDHGQNWTIIWSDSTSYTGYDNIFFLDENTGWMGGPVSDTLRKTTDSGSTWNIQKVQYEGGIGEIQFINENKGWVAGGYEIIGTWPLGGEGYIYVTNDGGDNWTQQKHVIQDMFLGIDFGDSLNGTAIGYNGMIYHTNDGGVNWIEQLSTMFRTLNMVDFINAHYGWICGDGGAILNTKTGGITKINNKSTEPIISKDFVLFQNYPNPFNVLTTIKYLINIPSKYRLEIFNILGEHIITLCDNYFTPGIYKIIWDGKNKFGYALSSGLYIIKLENKISDRKIIETKKMILLK